VHCIEIGDLALNLGQVLARDCVNSSARSSPLVGQTQQFAHLLDGKSKIARPPNKTQSSKVFGTVNAVVPARPPRGRQEVDTLVVADCFNFGVGLPGKSTDRERCFRHAG
jgi:hypothetical protein